MVYSFLGVCIFLKQVECMCFLVQQPLLLKSFIRRLGNVCSNVLGKDCGVGLKAKGLSLRIAEVIMGSPGFKQCCFGSV